MKAAIDLSASGAPPAVFPFPPSPPLHSLYYYATILTPIIYPATTSGLKRPQSALEDRELDEEPCTIPPTGELALFAGQSCLIIDPAALKTKQYCALTTSQKIHFRGI